MSSVSGDVRETENAPASPPVIVIVASTGRAEEVDGLLERLDRQTRPPRRVVLSVVRETDVSPATRDGTTRPEAATASTTTTEVVYGRPGLCAQRNAALDHLGTMPPDALAVFYDDDFVPALDALEGLVATFERHAGLVGCDGTVVADGVGGAGIGYAEAVRLADRHVGKSAGTASPSVRLSRSGLYGCNMAFRSAAMGSLRFDERLPLYGWQEDVDFANRVLIAAGGTAAGASLAHSDAFAGVHRGVKKARSAGRPLGYSQIANPVYLMRKGTLPASFGARLVARNVLANVAGSLRPEPWVDRRGRLRGNLLGLVHLITGRLEPERMLALCRAAPIGPDPGRSVS